MFYTELVNAMRSMGYKSRSINKVYDLVYDNYNNRPFHNIGHIIDMLKEIDSVKMLNMELSLAVIFHDIVYDPTRTDNEEESAKLFQKTFYKEPQDFLDRVTQMILDTKTHIPTSDNAVVLCDADLSILGRGWNIYKYYMLRIREEYNFVPNEVYNNKRIEILQGFLQREFIFNTPVFRDLYERSARINIQCEIELLTKT